MRILRGLLGTFFIFVLAVFLLSSIVRFELLDSDTWTQALVKGDAYDQIEELFLAWLKVEAGAQGVAVFQQQISSATLVQTMVEENVEQVLGFVRGANERLVLSVPVNQLGLMQGAKSIPSSIDVSEMAELDPQIAAALDGVQIGYMVLNAIWFISAILAIGALLLFYRSGAKGQRISGLGKLLLATGIFTLIGVGVVLGVAGVIGQLGEVEVPLGAELVTVEFGGVVQSVLQATTMPSLVTGVVLIVVGVVLLIVAKARNNK